MELDYEYYQRSQLMKNIFVMIFFSLIIIISLIDNLLVCYVVFSKRRMRLKQINILIANLAISDLMMTIFNIPFNIIRILTNNWPFGSFMCKLIPYFQMTSVYGSTFTMTIIALNRYKALNSSLKNQINISSKPFNPLIIIFSIWLLALSLSSQQILYNQTEMTSPKTISPEKISSEAVSSETISPETISPEKSTIICRAIYPKPEYGLWMPLLAFLTQFIIPLSVTGITYLLIGIQIWKRARLGVMTQEQINCHIKSKKKSIKIMFLVVIAFVFSWFPINIYCIFTESNSEQNYDSTTFLICLWIALSSVCYNPIIYFGLNKQYRDGVKELMIKIQCNGTQLSSDEYS